MIERFVASWELFGTAWLYGWIAAVLLALLGVSFVSRNRIFLGAAASQCAVLGIAAGLWLGERFGTAHGGTPDLLLRVTAACGALGAVLFAGGSQRAHETREGRSALLFLGAGALAMLVVARSPFGLREVERVLHSTFLGATDGDLVLVTLGTAASLLAFGVWHRPLRLLVLDPAEARALWPAARFLDLGLRLWTGLWLGLVIQAAGAAFGFALLVLPALAARYFVRTLAGLFVLAPLLALVTGLPAFVLAHDLDLPPAQVQIALLALLTAAGFAVGRSR